MTLGPGQEKSLQVGLTHAQELGRELGVPVIPVSHIEGHVLVINKNLTIIYRPLVLIKYNLKK